MPLSPQTSTVLQEKDLPPRPSIVNFQNPGVFCRAIDWLHALLRPWPLGLAGRPGVATAAVTQTSDSPIPDPRPAPAIP